MNRSIQRRVPDFLYEPKLFLGTSKCNCRFVSELQGGHKVHPKRIFLHSAQMNTFFFLPTLLVVLFSVAYLGESAPYFQAFSDECKKWAVTDGECINNHPFMWSKCFESCAEFATDDDERCEGWADEGECANNPNYIQVHCPLSCSKAIAWNPWTRATLGSPCIYPAHNAYFFSLYAICLNCRYRRCSDC